MLSTLRSILGTAARSTHPAMSAPQKTMLFSRSLLTAAPDSDEAQLIGFINGICDENDLYPGEWLTVTDSGSVEVGVGNMSKCNAIATRNFHIEVHGENTLKFFSKVNEDKNGNYTPITDSNECKWILGTLNGAKLPSSGLKKSSEPADSAQNMLARFKP